LSELNEDPLFDFGVKYSSGFWVPWRIEVRLDKAGQSFFVLVGLENSDKKAHLQCVRQPKFLCEGEIVHLHKGWMSFLDKDLVGVEVACTRLSSARSLLDAIAAALKTD